jgi:hypothetical protein
MSIKKKTIEDPKVLHQQPLGTIHNLHQMKY